MFNAVPLQDLRVSFLAVGPPAAGKAPGRVAGALFAVVVVVSIAILAFLARLTLSAAEPLELLVVLLVALRLGLLQASAASIAAALALDYLFTQPLFKFTIADPQNWIALVTFETIALFVSRLSSRARAHATEAEKQKHHAVILYELSRSILYLQQQQPIAEQLSPLIRDLVGADTVGLWSITEEASSNQTVPVSGPGRAAYEAYLGDRNIDDVETCCSSRSLRLGMTVIGGMTLHGWRPDPLMADAVASLAALAFERARASAAKAGPRSPVHPSSSERLSWMA